MRIVYYDLTLFSEEKTEQPTQKKLQDSRKKGQVVQSKDFNGALSLLAVFMTLSSMWGYFINEVLNYFYKTIDLIPNASVAPKYFNTSVQFIIKMSLPLLLVAMVVGVVSSYAQVGVLFTGEPLKPKLSKLNPLKGLKNMFSSRALVELFKSVSKATLILLICYSYINSRLAEITYTLRMTPQGIVVLLWSIIYNVIIRCGILLFVIAIFDYVFKKRKNKKELMMSKQEVKQEYKQSEGDPMLKGKIKEKQRQMAMGRMMQQVPKADVIITNPTHYAVALVYDTSRGDAPILLAKGVDLIAQNIKRVAAENNIPMVENPPLARTIYATIDVGGAISPDLYEAVAEVLAYVYSINKVA